MKNKSTWCAVGIAALIAASSMATAQEIDSSGEPARLAVQLAAGQHVSTAAELPVLKSCCGDPQGCNDPANCDTCQNCPGCQSTACQVTALLANRSGGVSLPPPADPGEDCDCRLCRDMDFKIERARPLPGAAGFLKENSSELAASRRQLAWELAEYLGRRPHDNEHVRELLQAALEATADQAHRAAMEQHDTFQVETAVQPEIAALNFEMAETRRMILETQQDLQLINESLNFLARHMQQQWKNEAARQNPLPATGVHWQSRPDPGSPEFVGQLDRVHQLQQQVRRLEQQLQASRPASEEQLLASSWKDDGGRLLPARYESQRLQPRIESALPLKPETPVRVWRHYYVGDLINHPVASSTFRLMQKIKSGVAPDSWADASIQIAAPAVSLMILQTPENHRQIEVMLREMGGMLR